MLYTPRSTSLKSLLAALLLSSVVSAQLSPANTQCRCLYGQSCWPNQAAFESLSQNLSQPLIHPTPVAAPCYADLSSSTCANVQSHFSDAIWRTDQPGAYEFQNFESYTRPDGTIDACYLDTTLGSPCKQGSIPPIGVDARNMADIKAAIAFAKTYNLKLVIKNTGHDYQGRSIARDAFMLWTHNIKGMTYNAAFTPTGGPAGTTYDAITTSAGDQWVDAYALALQHGRMLVGPFSLGGSLGTAGGIAQGGGDGVWSPRHGLAVDNILQYTIVTASGNVLTANAYQNPTLFWALRGGGPGVFGVVISVTYKTHPSFSLSYATFNADITDPAAAQTVVTRVVQDIVQFTDMGWGGYMYIIQPGSLRGVWVAPEVSQADLATTLDPFGTFLNDTTGGKGGIFYNSSTSYYGWYDESYLGGSGSQVTGNIKLASRLLSKELALSDPATVASKILAVDSLFKGFDMILGGAVNQVAASATGANPSFRHSIASIIINELWFDGTSSTAIAQQIERLKSNTAILDGISTDHGSYMNQGSLYETDFKQTFFGSNYAALAEIKRKHDPTSLFIVPNGLLSDQWDSEQICRL